MYLRFFCNEFSSIIISFSFFGMNKFYSPNQDDYLYIGNHRNHGSKSMSAGNPEMEKVMQKFFRKGEVGDWKNHFSPELNQKIDEWISKNLTGSDLKFVTELDKQD